MKHYNHSRSESYAVCRVESWSFLTFHLLEGYWQQCYKISWMGHKDALGKKSTESSSSSKFTFLVNLCAI